MHEQSEVQAIAKIKAICQAHLESFDAIVIERKREDSISYIATIGILSREGNISKELMDEVFEKLERDPSCLFSFWETRRSIQDLSFEELYIKAKVTSNVGI